MEYLDLMFVCLLGTVLAFCLAKIAVTNMKIDGANGFCVTKRRAGRFLLRFFCLISALFVIWLVFSSFNDIIDNTNQQKAYSKSVAESQNYIAGLHAFDNGIEITKNPFPIGTVDYLDWEDGWSHEKNNSIKTKTQSNSNGGNSLTQLILERMMTSDVVNPSPGLFERWMAIERGMGRSPGDILAELNAVAGTKYKHNWPSVVAGRGYQLERCPIEVRQYMMRRVLADELSAIGVELATKELEALIWRLT